MSLKETLERGCLGSIGRSVRHDPVSGHRRHPPGPRCVPRAMHRALWLRSRCGSGVGPHVLGAGEREWRECVYQGVEKYLIPNTRTPEAYRKAIAEDREMTPSIAAGKITRAHRRARVQDLLEEIDRIEEANMAKIVREREAVDRVMKEEMQRQLDSTRQSMILPLAR